MRTALWGIVVASSALAGSLSLGAGCGSLPDDCRDLFTCLTGGGGGSSGTSTSTGTGGDGGPPPSCIPGAGKAAVADTCGLFVSTTLGNDTAPGVGTQQLPFKTLGAALAAAEKKQARVYVCAETFTEAVTVTYGNGIYGGLDCANGWAYTGTAKSTLAGGVDAVPLTLSATASGVEVFDFKVIAADAMIDSGSSIAVIADQVTASLTRCDLIAGNGKAGLAGTTPTDSVGPSSQFDDAIRGNDGAKACPAMGSSQLGGESKDNMFCPSVNGGPIGGSGGNGEVSFGGDGTASVANAQTALGGKGQLAADSTLSCVTGNGQPGAPGTPGGDGAGAIGMSALGQLSISGYAGVSGMPGDVGKPGQGGGGGGGAKGKTLCAGASGGGGGTGGCGGHGGTGGKAGGASIGIVHLGATITFDAVTIQLGTGGDGGQGAFGQGGGVGGKGGSGGAGDSTAPITSLACDGGNGGSGGLGGQGGGGRGGHAIGIAASGKIVPDTKGVTVTQKGKAGLGGKGGPSQDGDPGIQEETLPFP